MEGDALTHITIYMKNEFSTNDTDKYIPSYEITENSNDQVLVSDRIFPEAFQDWCRDGGHIVQIQPWDIRARIKTLHNELCITPYVESKMIKIAEHIEKNIEKYIDKIYEAPRKQRGSQSIRRSQRCIADTLKKQQCKKRTAHTKKCWIHLAKQDNLRIKPSNIISGGKGLYSWKKQIPRGKNISKFTGRITTKEELDQLYGDVTAKYAVCNRRGKCINSNYTTDGAARFANDARKTPFKNNAQIRGRQILRLKASKKIPPHQEIFTSYGREYWK
ncbi:SET domain-containing [Paramuricea clavata]|uniref:SET domain-containing n=1 Tax=Paramuricea clavata TaxID=317549 RepID=A0A7D9HAX7_PARCT|nr:SET domain-containing [Paramuricea clavata]